MAFRKLQLSEVKSTFEELAKAGVYLLLGYDETSSPVVYIGQAERLSDRLQLHSRSADKVFWTDTIVMSSNDDSLTSSHVRYVEARLIADAQKNVRWNLTNVQRASEQGKLPLPDRDSMEQFIENAKILVGALGNLADGFAYNISNLAWDHLQKNQALLLGTTNTYRTDKGRPYWDHI